jgi:hypothetical protein
MAAGLTSIWRSYSAITKRCLSLVAINDALLWARPATRAGQSRVPAPSDRITGQTVPLARFL